MKKLLLRAALLCTLFSLTAANLSAQSANKQVKKSESEPEAKSVVLKMEKLKEYRNSNKYFVNAKLQYDEPTGFGVYIKIIKRDKSEAPQVTWFHAHLKTGKIDNGGNGAHFKAGPSKGDNQGFAVKDNEAQEFYEEMKNKNLSKDKWTSIGQGGK